ncbi:transposase [Streptomyces decoyicus]|uniref:IS701 family transposase n=1 Tax=Streptomyces decoyicus TaxID=249567 RepID=UPI00363B583D
MTRRVPCPPAPGPLEAYAARFDDLFATLAQRRGFREYLTGLLLPRDRNKTLTCLAGTEPVVGAQHAAVQRLRFFLSESTWDHEQVNARRVELLLADLATAPHPGGVLVIDDSGDRKDGKATAHIGRQWLGRLGKTDNGIVTVITCWADENRYYPLHAVPYSPTHHFPTGKKDPDFRTKLQIAAELARTAKADGVTFRAVAAGCAYGDQDSFRRQLDTAGLPFVMALKPSHGSWAYGKDAYIPVHAARALTWMDTEHPGDWTPVERTFRDGHTETWWAADAQLGWWGPDRNVRLVVATTDPGTPRQRADERSAPPDGRGLCVSRVGSAAAIAAGAASARVRLSGGRRRRHSSGSRAVGRAEEVGDLARHVEDDRQLRSRGVLVDDGVLGQEVGDSGTDGAAADVVVAGQASDGLAAQVCGAYSGGLRCRVLPAGHAAGGVYCAAVAAGMSTRAALRAGQSEASSEPARAIRMVRARRPQGRTNS